MEKISRFYVFALAAHGTGLSGGDRIFIELARRWSKKFPVIIYVTKEGYEMCQTQKLNVSSIKYQILSNKSAGYFLINYIYRIIQGLRLGLTLKLENSAGEYIYNASEFWMDSIPCTILKVRYPDIKWIATWFQTAPNPLVGFAEGKRDVNYRFKAFQYWFMQLPIKPLITKFADKIIVNNEDEKKRFPIHTKRGDTIVMIGAVPLTDIKKFLSSNDRLLPIKKYDAVFQGRFHPQKGVVELVDIWKRVVETRPNAKLAMIGDGPQMGDVKSKIENRKLENNIEIFGYVFDGDKKYKIFLESKVVVHPAYYDSGGMAAAEAMAFGLPCVGFNLKAYESYYPKGMVKVTIGDKKAFANEIIKLLSDNSYYVQKAKEATDMTHEKWSWEKRAEEILSEIQK